MKKTFCFLLTLLFLFSCALAQAPSFPWVIDSENHWQTDASGAAVHLGSHTLDEDTLCCTVCGYMFLDWGEGYADAALYDEAGNLLHGLSFENGEKTYESAHALTRDDAGHVLKDIEYINGVLYGETIYTVNDAGEQIPVTATAWNDDGTTSINEYDEHGNNVRACVLSPEGAVMFETLSEFALNDEGWYYECKTISRFDSGDTFLTESNQYGDPLRTLNTFADGTVWADMVYEYGYQEHVKLWSKQYSFGKLFRETTFAPDGSGWQETEYQEDGGWSISVYDSDSDIITVTTYAADGSVLSQDAY